MQRSDGTRQQASNYYRRAAKWLLPHLKNVPMSFLRFPDGVEGESFWEKDAPGFTPKWVKTVAVPRRSGPPIHYILINDVRTLLWLVDVGMIELHPFLHRAPRLERATSVVLDLDPGSGAGITECCEVALLLRDALQAIGLASMAKVSGSKGLQVYVPLNTDATHDATEAFARVVAETLARAHPKLVVAKMAKELRAGKVFIDWSQNADYKTTVAVYSLRATGNISMPVTWAEVEKVRPVVFEPEAALKRLARRGDLFASVLKKRQTLPFSAPPAKRARKEEAPDVIVNGIRLPRPKSQSGRRLFILTKTELWLERGGVFRRFRVQRVDAPHPQPLSPRGGERVAGGRVRGRRIVATFVGEARVQPDDAEDIGAYERIQRNRFWFTGRRLEGEWVLDA
ncbi:MAG TPA: non-homologous end-joining DNA ligase [Thermoanaerobaculia bacterium]|nr:non-homologous end-joining DNA ligase [Thermoanaerobaculia bacterium]